MKWSALLGTGLFLFLLTLGSSPAFAGADADPAEVAARCKERLAQIGDGVSTRVSEICDGAVARIEEALANGDVEAARAAARRAIRRIRRIADHAGDEIGQTTRRCVRALRRLEADEELIQCVLTTSREARAAIHGAARDCVAAIQEALGGGGE